MATKKKPSTKKISPKKGTPKSQGVREEGPKGWLFQALESAYARLGPPTAYKERPEKKLKVKKGAKAFESHFQPGKREEVLAPLGMNHWAQRLSEYKLRKSAAAGPLPQEHLPMPGMPAIPGQNNWTPLGPSIIARGQAS